MNGCEACPDLHVVYKEMATQIEDSLIMNCITSRCHAPQMFDKSLEKKMFYAIRRHGVLSVIRFDQEDL